MTEASGNVTRDLSNVVGSFILLVLPVAVTFACTFRIEFTQLQWVLIVIMTLIWWISIFADADKEEAHEAVKALEEKREREAKEKETPAPPIKSLPEGTSMLAVKTIRTYEVRNGELGKLIKEDEAIVLPAMVTILDGEKTRNGYGVEIIGY